MASWAFARVWEERALESKPGREAIARISPVRGSSATTAPGDRVVIAPPVYPPFAICTAEAGCVTVPVPLRDTGSAWEMDLAGIDGTFTNTAQGDLWGRIGVGVFTTALRDAGAA